MLALMLSDQCTTGWLHWGGGELWLTPTALVRVGRTSLTIDALIAGATFGTVTDAVRRHVPGVEPGVIDDDVWAAYLASARRVLVLDLAAVEKAKVARGVMTSRLQARMSDGRTHKLLWQRDGDVALRLILRAINDLPAHRSVFTEAESNWLQSADDYLRYEGLRYRPGFLDGADPTAILETLADLHRMPAELQESLVLVSEGEASWPHRHLKAAIDALADHGRVVRIVAGDPGDHVGVATGVLHSSTYEGAEVEEARAQMCDMVDRIRPDRRGVVVWDTGSD